MVRLWVIVRGWRKWTFSFQCNHDIRHHCIQMLVDFHELIAGQFRQGIRSQFNWKVFHLANQLFPGRSWFTLMVAVFGIFCINILEQRRLSQSIWALGATRATFRAWGHFVWCGPGGVDDVIQGVFRFFDVIGWFLGQWVTFRITTAIQCFCLHFIATLNTGVKVWNMKWIKQQCVIESIPLQLVRIARQDRHPIRDI